MVYPFCDAKKYPVECVPGAISATNVGRRSTLHLGQELSWSKRYGQAIPPSQASRDWIQPGHIPHTLFESFYHCFWQLVGLRITKILSYFSKEVCFQAQVSEREIQKGCAECVCRWARV